MSSTNKTTNYNLPQFIGNDKPAWLGDINPAMSTIDTTMKANETLANQGIADASTAKTAANAAQTTADGAATAAATAQSTANTAVSGVNTVTAELNNFIQNSIINDYETKSVALDDSNSEAKFTLAQSADGSVFKFYGEFIERNFTNGNITLIQSSRRVNVPGLSGYYGVDTGLVLNTAPTEAFIVNPAGTQLWSDATNLQSQVVRGIGVCAFAVGTDGHIYVTISNATGAYIIEAHRIRRSPYFPCVYYNTNFGDIPTPNN